MIKLHKDENKGVTLIAALMTIFDLKKQNEIIYHSLFNTYEIRGVDYDCSIRGDYFIILEAK